MAFGEWDENQLSKRVDSTLHHIWIKFVLEQTLGFENLLAEGQAIPQTIKSEIPEYRETIRPDIVVNDPNTNKARVLVQVYPKSQSLTKPIPGKSWTLPDGRMMQLLHDTGIRLGIVTNGDQWMLVNAKRGESTGYASWYSSLWLEEPITLRAFRTLLGTDRLFSVPDNETLEALLDASASDQQEVTDQLGYQVRKAVEVVIQALDKANQEHGRKLLEGVSEKVLYESALTVMMRLVFLFCAEERELLPRGDDLYDKNYAVSTLREQLRVTADQFGEEILGLRHDAWSRLLTTFRAVYAGLKHDRLKLPAYGGSLFNPDRFPFLEGRQFGTSWKNTEAAPLPISNRTVLHILEALQVLQTKVGKTIEARSLSFRSLDIEQIGHVYEGLLDHTAKRATEPYLGLSGTRDKEPEISLAELEKLLEKGEKDTLKFLKEETGRSESAIKKGLEAKLDDHLAARFRTACQETQLWERVKPFAGLVRLDNLDYPLVINTDSVFVTSGTDRRSSGTHYTPRILTEPIVQYTLEPLVYIGPAEGLPKEEWKLRSAKELLELRICDMACGSGAFLVQVCRYLAARLLEAWEFAKNENPGEVRITPEGIPSTGSPDELLIPDDPDERHVYALRIVAQRCIYGVDINPLAVEMAKLSLWLLTLSKDKPFEFLDHAIRCGDSLVGLHDIEQLKRFSLKPDSKTKELFKGPLDDAVNEAINLRLKLEDMSVTSVEDVKRQEELLAEANDKIARLRFAADLLVSAEFWGENAKDKLEKTQEAARLSEKYLQGGNLEEFEALASKARNGQKMFHWCLEFPEVMIKRGGFDGFVGNPPFMGGKKISGALGTPFRNYLVELLAGNTKGHADLCAYFFLRVFSILSKKGQFGLIATNTIAQGDTREVGLDQLERNHSVITRAIQSQKWTGVANLEVAQVWGTNGDWKGKFSLNNTEVSGITPYLTAKEMISGNPHSIVANLGFAYIGIVVYGEGFVLSVEEAEHLLQKNSRNKEVILPYLNGENFNSNPTQSPERYVIDFAGRSFEEAIAYDECFEILMTKVKPFRATVAERNMRENWWLHQRPRPSLRKAITGLDRMLARSRVSNINSIAFVPTSVICSDAMVVFASDKHCDLAILQAAPHTEWLTRYASSMRTDVRYNPSDCLETYPMPPTKLGLDGYGMAYEQVRSTLMLSRQEGLTKTYNRFHDPNEASEDIQKLRDLHVEMDNAVADAYGWSDLKLDHGFHETKQGLRYTISEPARREVLQRLLKLNHERYAEEVKQGLHEKKATKKSAPKATTKKSAKKDTETPKPSTPMLDFGDDESQ
jgi:hypothetical protein